MRFRCLLRLLIAALLSYGVIVAVPSYVETQCSRPELQHTAPCTFYFTAQKNIRTESHALWESVTSHRYAVAATKKYKESGLEPRLSHYSSELSHRWHNDVQPMLVEVSRNATRITIHHTKCVSRQANHFARTKALPFLRKNGIAFKNWSYKQLINIWERIQTSRVWEDVVIPQTRNIYDTVLHRAANVDDVNVVDKQESLNSQKEQITRKSKVQETPGESLSTHSSASSVSSSTVSAAPSAETATVAAESDNVHGSAAAREPGAWLAKVERNVQFAVKNLEEDAQTFLQRSIEAAKPDITERLRAIVIYGEKAVLDYTKMTEDLLARTPESEKMQKGSVYSTYDEYMKHLAELAFKVRDRVEQLAHDSVEGLGPVRSVTLDALDDYFDVVLTEVAREMTANDDWNGWKEYHQLKQLLKERRESIENFEFNMEIVNTALKESQSASVLLVQQYNQKLTELRAQCQIVFQERAERELKLEREDKNSDRIEPESGFEESTASSDEEESQVEAGDAAGSADVTESENVVTEDVDIELPFTEDVELKDPEYVESVWQNQQII